MRVPGTHLALACSKALDGVLQGVARQGMLGVYTFLGVFLLLGVLLPRVGVLLPCTGVLLP